MFVDEGGKKADACRLFRIGHDTLYRWLRQRVQEGSIQPRPRGKYKTRKLDDQKLRDYISSHSDETLSEIAAAFDVSHVAVWKACKRLGITHKKKPSIS